MKQEANGIVENEEAIFVARGFSQVEVIHYEYNFSPIARYSSVRSILTLSTNMGCYIHHMYMRTTFVDGVIEEEVYIEQLEGFETFEIESYVCRLKRALYGMKKTPRAWYIRIDNYFTGLGFTKCEVDANL